MSLCCFSQEQQQQRQSALLATGDRALLVPTHHALCFSGCISQDHLSTPWRTAGPSFAASRHSSGLLLRSATSQLHFLAATLGCDCQRRRVLPPAATRVTVPRLGRRGPCFCASRLIWNFHCEIQSRAVPAGFQAFGLVPLRSV